MSRDRFQQALYHFLHGTKQLPRETLRRMRNYCDRCNFFRRGDPWRNSWHQHKLFIDKNKKRL